jgi:hypothetical protein
MVFAGATMWFADSTGGKANMPLHMISTIVKGDKAMAAGSTSAGVGVLVHLALSALFGTLFALAVYRTTCADPKLAVTSQVQRAARCILAWDSRERRRASRARPRHCTGGEAHLRAVR